MSASRVSALVATFALLSLFTFGFGQDDLQDPAGPQPRSLAESLLQEIDGLHRTIDILRLELAEARLETAESRRELDELQQFLRDHNEYAGDFERYLTVRAATEREAQRERQDAARRQLEIRRAERGARQEQARTQRERHEAELARVRQYRDAGFAPLGFDVYLGQMAFYYDTDEGIRARIDWDLSFGRYIRLGRPFGRVDYSSMTVSGSVLNTSGSARNIGVALTFFDENGSQVGAEIVQVNNARPNVPYPFTATLDMALNRPFASSSSHVLYADPVG